MLDTSFVAPLCFLLLPVAAGAAEYLYKLHLPVGFRVVGLNL